MRQPRTGANSESIVISNTAVALTTIPASAQAAHISVHEQRLRFYYDGSTPTATSGHVGIVDREIDLESREEVTNFKAIREGGTDARISVTYHLRSYPDERRED